MTFYGYKRPDGRVGVRNYVLILPASVCASDTTRIIAQQVVGSVTFNNQQGCSQVASDQQLTMDVMAGYAANPNVYGTVVVSLGCENCQMDLVVEAIQERTNKPLKQVIIQEAGGTLKAVDMAVRYAKETVKVEVVPTILLPGGRVQGFFPSGEELVRQIREKSGA